MYTLYYKKNCNNYPAFSLYIYYRFVPFSCSFHTFLRSVMIILSSSLLILSESSKGKYVNTVFIKCWPCRQDFIWPQNVSPWRGSIKHNVNNKSPNWQQWDGSCEVVTSLNWVDITSQLFSSFGQSSGFLLSSFVSPMYSPTNVMIICLIAHSRSTLKHSTVLFGKVRYWDDHYGKI